MGSGASVNAFFGIMTMIIAVPTGVKVFNWLFTMFQGRVRLDTPMLWFLGFAIVFVLGGMTGVMMSIPAVDFQVHNTLFLVAHFHSVIIGGVVFGFFAGYSYWFPKFTGIMLNERIGKWAFGFWLSGFLLAFMPLYLLGFMGATRRLDHYEPQTGFFPLFAVAGVGAILICIGFGLQILQILVSIKENKKDLSGDPWNGRTLEWSTSSPPPHYNFAHIPEVHSIDPFWEMKKEPEMKKKPLHEIHMPSNTGVGVYLGALSFIFGFAMIWHMFWLAILSAIIMVGCLIARLYEKNTEYYISVEEIKRDA